MFYEAPTVIWGFPKTVQNLKSCEVTCAIFQLQGHCKVIVFPHKIYIFINSSNLYASPNVIRMIKSRWMRWTWYVARVGQMKSAYKILGRNPEGKRTRKTQA
jgi:hypothetical protein